MRTYAARVVLDSVCRLTGCRLTTMQWTYPRIIHDELLTHRRLCRNTTSSRAKPVAKFLEEVRQSPYVPDHWGTAQKGMQARAEIDPGLHPQARAAWLAGRDAALKTSETLLALGLHKQVVNYVLIPYSWVDVVITSTHWSNLFALRVHPDAHPAFQRVAGLAKAAYLASKPQWRKPGEWHLPYVEDDDRAACDPDTVGGEADLVAMSVARCARVSVKTFDTETKDRASDLRLYGDLKRGAGDGIGHWSPFEHAACCLDVREWRGPLLGWIPHRRQFPNEEVHGAVPDSEFRGWLLEAGAP